MPAQLRRLFASILLFCDPREVNAKKLYNDHKYELSEDFIHEIQSKKIIQELSNEDINIAETKALVDIEKYLSFYEKTLTDYSFIPINYSLLEEEYVESDLVTEELDYNVDKLNATLAKLNLLNTDQMKIYNIIIRTVNISAEEENI